MDVDEYILPCDASAADIAKFRRMYKRGEVYESFVVCKLAVGGCATLGYIAGYRRFCLCGGATLSGSDENDPDSDTDNDSSDSGNSLYNLYTSQATYTLTPL